MKNLPVTHGLVRALVVVLVLGALVGVCICLKLALQSPPAISVLCTVFALLYAGIGVAAIGLWRGSRLGLQWTRLLLLAQVPYLQMPWLVYTLCDGFSLNLFIGNRLGVTFYSGAQFNLRFMFGGAESTDVMLGVNAAALAAFMVLRHVQLEPLPNPHGEPEQEVPATAE